MLPWNSEARNRKPVSQAVKVKASFGLKYTFFERREQVRQAVKAKATFGLIIIVLMWGGQSRGRTAKSS